jgi:hypothetical protein
MLTNISKEIVAYLEKCNPFVKLLLVRMHSGKNAGIFLISIGTI